MICYSNKSNPKNSRQSMIARAFYLRWKRYNTLLLYKQSSEGVRLFHWKLKWSRFSLSLHPCSLELSKCFAVNYANCFWTAILPNTHKQIFLLTLHKKWSFWLRVSSVNVTKSAEICGFGRIYWNNPSWKTSFFCAVLQ